MASFSAHASRYTRKITLLAFSTHLRRPRGCPLAGAFEHVREAILAQPDCMGEPARLLSLDPEHDTRTYSRFTRGYEASASLCPGISTHILLF